MRGGAEKAGKARQWKAPCAMAKKLDLPLSYLARPRHNCLLGPHEYQALIDSSFQGKDEDVIRLVFSKSLIKCQGGEGTGLESGMLVSMVFQKSKERSRETEMRQPVTPMTLGSGTPVYRGN